MSCVYISGHELILAVTLGLLFKKLPILWQKRVSNVLDILIRFSQTLGFAAPLRLSIIFTRYIFSLPQPYLPYLVC